MIDSVDMSLSKFWEIMKDREAWYAQSMGSQRVRHDSTPEDQQQAESLTKGQYQRQTGGKSYKTSENSVLVNLSISRYCLY